MKDMPVDVALSATVFFYRLGIKLQTCTLDYLAKETLKEGVQQASKPTSRLSGDGISQYIRSLKEMSEELIKLQKPVFISAL
jgi:hypothetical protein